MNIQDKFKKEYTIYKIVNDIDLKGGILNIPSGSTLIMMGGKFRNGTIHCNNTNFINLNRNNFIEVKFTGVVNNLLSYINTDTGTIEYIDIATLISNLKTNTDK